MKKILLMMLVMCASLAASAQTWELVKSIDYSESNWKGWQADKFQIAGGALVVVNETAKAQNYEVQYHGLNEISVEENETYKVCVTIQGSAAGNIFLALCDWGHNGQNGKTLAFSTEKTTIEYEVKSSFSASCFLMMQSGLFAGTYNVYKVEVYKYKEEAGFTVENATANIAADTHVKKETGNNFTNVPGNQEIIVNAAKNKTGWDSQFWIVFDEVIPNGADLTISFDRKASAAATANTGCHGLPDGNNWHAGGPFSVDFTTEYTHFEKTFTVNDAQGLKSLAFDLTKEDQDMVYYFKNIVATIGLEMGEPTFSIKNGDRVEIGSWDGISITFPSNNGSTVLNGNAHYDGGKFELVATEAMLYEAGNSTPIAKETSATSNKFAETKLFSGVTLTNGKEYTVTIAKFGLQLTDIANDDPSSSGIYWTNKKVYTTSFKALDKIPTFEFTEKNADITTFNFADASNYDKETGKFTANGGWTFSTPKDLSAHKWLVVTTTYNASKAGGEFRVKDANGKSIGGEDYNKGDGVSRGSMWIDRWNNQICATVSMEYLAENGIDITKIASVSFSANQPISAVYLTNYEDGKAIATKSGSACAGDYVREYSNIATSGSKFGTIALKYAAAVSGAYVYTVDAFDAEAGLTLSRHYGVLEAGVPYIFEAIDEVGLNGEGNNCNVNFFRVDENAVTDDWSDNTARDNGLVGYYDGGFTPGAGVLGGCYLLSENKLHEIDGGTIDLGKNRCFFDPTKCSSKGGSSNVRIAFEDTNATAIKSVVEKSMNSGKIFDINGREVKTMSKGGIYVINGMKVMVK